MRQERKIPLWKRIWHFFSLLIVIGALMIVYHANTIIEYTLDQYREIGFVSLLPVFLMIIGLGVQGIFDLLGGRRICRACHDSGEIALAWGYEDCPRCGGTGYIGE